MDFTKLLPNKTLLWKEWKNNGILIIVFALFVSYVSSYSLIKGILSYYYLEQGYVLEGFSYMIYEIRYLLSFESDFCFMAEFVFIFFTVMLGALMVGRERDHKTYDLLLGLPYSRFDIIHNKFIAGLGQLFIVFTFNALIMTVLVLANSEISFPFGIGDIWYWAFVNVIVLSYIFAFTMFISSLSGTTLGNGLLSYIFLFFPAGIVALLALNLDFWNIDFWNSSLSAWASFIGEFMVSLTPPLYLLGKDLLDEIYHVPGYVIMFTLVFVLYYFTQRLFARNRLENNGEVLVFEETEGFFKAGVVVCFTLLCGPIVLYLLGIQRVYNHHFMGIFGYLIVGVVFWFLVNWLVKSRKVV